MDKQVVVKNGVGLPTLLFLLFLTLKLLGKITWSWWWVTSPLWIGWGISLTFLFLFLLIMVFAAAAQR